MSSSDSDRSNYESAESDSDEEEECPLHLIQADDTDDNGNNKDPFLKLNEEALHRVLKSTKGRPLSIIAIVGPPQSGKSILLNFIKCGLEAKEKGGKSKSSSIGGQNEPLTGFKWNADQSDKCTIGIWVWSRAFLLSGAVNDVAVILLDTQGLSDSMASSAILGLSFLSSSIMIYNADANSPDASLFNPLSTYFKYGLCCLEKDEELSEEDPPFQNLTFLFRDWNDPEKYAFGKRGGKSFLDDKLASLRGRTKMETKEGLNCFQKAASYLLPPMKDVDGNIPPKFEGCVDDLDDEFLKQVEKFLTNLLKSENLLSKKTFGVETSSTEFSNFLNHYVQMYNEAQKSKNYVVDEETILEITCTTFHSNIVSKSLEKYHEIFDKRSKTIPVQNQEAIQTNHENALKQANLVFKRARKLEDYANKYEEKLQTELQALLQNKLAETSSFRSQVVQECFEKAKDSFKSKLLEEPDYNPKIVDELKQNVTQEFLDNLATDDEDDTVELTRSLHSELELIQQQFSEQENDQNLSDDVEEITYHKIINKVSSQPTHEASASDDEENANKKNTGAKKFMLDLKEQLIQEYKKGMKEMNAETPTSDSTTLLNNHYINQAKVMESFNQNANGNEFESEIRTEIENSMNLLYKEMEENLLENLEEKFEEAESLLNTEVQAYSQSLAENRGRKISIAINQHKIWNIMNKFEEKCPFPVGSQESDDLKEKLHAALEAEYNTISGGGDDVDNGAAVKAQKMKQIEDECFQQYETDMNMLRHGAEFMEPGKLLKAHQNSLKKALSTFEKMGDGVEDYKEKFTTRLETEFSKMSVENDRIIELAQANGRNWIHECLKEYQQQMKVSTESCSTSKEFQQAHEKTKRTVLVSFGKKWKYTRSKSFKQDHENKLVSEMDATFEEMEDFFKMRISSDVGTAEDLKEVARKFYHDEMAKFVSPQTHMEPTNLQELHKRIAKDAINYCKSKGPLKKNQKKMLKEWLEVSYQKYKDENDMVLNYAEDAEPAIGIDLGTTYCCVAVLYKGKVEIVRNATGQNTTPSYVRISQQDGEQVVGVVAKESAYRNAENTVFDAKRMIGRRFDDHQLQNDMDYWPFTVVKGAEGPAIQVFGNEYPPEQIASFILSQLVNDAEKYLGRTVKKAVITVPAYFNDGQRQATIDAGEMAGLEVLTILNEPTAASIAYKLERFHEDARNVLIFDLGGGTFDVALLKTDAGNIEILAVDGDTHLGGEDFDKAMMQYCAAEFEATYNIDLFKDKESDQKIQRDKAKTRLRRLQSYCEKGKIELSFARSTTISIDAFANGEDLSVTLSRDKFEELIAPHFTKALEIVERALKSAKIEEIDDIVLVGGSTRIPKVQELLSDFFNGKALNHTINPDEAVAYGAAVKAAMMNGDQAKKMFNFTSIQDVTPMSLGVEAFVNGIAGHFSVIVPKSSKIPRVIKQNYNTLQDNQESVLVKIYQGEQTQAKNNEFLGEFALKGIPPAPAGKELIEVHMEVNDMGILHVKAICKSTRGSEALVVNENKGRLSKRTKQKLLNEAKLSDVGVLRRSNTISSDTGSERYRETRKPRPKTLFGKFLR